MLNAVQQIGAATLGVAVLGSAYFALASADAPHAIEYVFAAPAVTVATAIPTTLMTFDTEQI